MEKINDDISRKTGNEVITKVCDVVRENLSEEYLFVRYMGPKFAIVFSGVDEQSIESFIEDIKKQVENIEVDPVDVEFEDDEEVVAKPKINIVITTYYKGTALEESMKKLESYLDNADQNENDINYL